MIYPLISFLIVLVYHYQQLLSTIYYRELTILNHHYYPTLRQLLSYRLIIIYNHNHQLGDDVKIVIKRSLKSEKIDTQTS